MEKYKVGNIKTILVLQSLKHDETQSGKELYDDYIIRQIEQKGDKSIIRHHNFFNTPNKKEFIEILNYINQNAPHFARGIIIHLEMHGSEIGLYTSDDSITTWTELVEIFSDINIKCINNLYITMATCYGRFLYQGVNPNLKSPYSGYISSSDTVNPDEIIEQFSMLFEMLIDNGNLVESYLEMEKHGTKFYYKDSKETFETAFLATVEEFMMNPEIKNNILEETKKQVEKEGEPMPPEDSFELISKLALRDIYNRQKKAFEF